MVPGMTQSAVENDTDISRENLSFLIATAAVIQLSESLLPSPIPGLRPGLANIISLIIFFQYGFRTALTVTLLRTVVSSFIIGSFLSPGFILSFTAGFASITAAAFCYRFSTQISFFRLSPLGAGIIGAFVHNMVQLQLAYLLFFNHTGIFSFIPWLALGSILTGSLSGGLTTAVLNRLTTKTWQTKDIPLAAPSFEGQLYQPGDSFVHRCPPTVKIALVIVVTLAAVILENLFFYAVLFCFITVLVPLASLKFAQIFSVLKKVWGILLGAFLLPLFFNHGSQELIPTPLGPIYSETIIDSFIFSTRIAVLALLSSLVARTTSIEAFTGGIRIYLQPLQIIGINSDAVARSISLAISTLPQVWVELRSVLVFLLEGKPRNFKTAREAAIDLILYLFTSRKNDNA